MGILSKILNFLDEGIWRINSRHLPKRKSLLLRQLRIFVLSKRGFDEDKCALQASALTYYTLMSIVPIVAMAFGIAKGFGFENVLEKILYEKMAGQEEVVGRIVTFSRTFLENTKGGLIAGIGVALLFWTVIKVLGNIEKAFNEIWGIKKPRSFGRKFSDYLSIMLICPILLIMSSSMTVLITSQVNLIMEKIAILGVLAPLVNFSLKFLPFLFLWLLFTFIYIFMPNTKVQFKSAFLGGIIAGTLYQVIQFLYFSAQIMVAKYGAIYGSFAALPLFLMWLQISWLVVLFGAEVAFAEQNVETYEFEQDCLKASHYFKRLMALRITHLCVSNFVKAKAPYTASQISHQLEVPIRLVRELLFQLTQAGVLVEVAFNNNAGEVSYQPARDIESLTVQNVISILNHQGIEDIPVEESEALKKIKDSLRAFEEQLGRSSYNVPLKSIEG
ncbi:MAG TPA: YihY/virulence factor BrkB family protein [Candidatus Omnitrophota bacterium]|nr:YihY/virulence factor BrkB family protein [Candidatus Omnitrophota bacterium]HSA31867.1 YihY/virulence factor BrkB family protein [Candidatus Omnitrophota bacterium]